MANLRPFRFAAALHDTASATEFVEGARRVEALGYDVLLTGDHLTPRWFAPGPALMAAALSTTALRVSCTVFDNDFRHPALLAKETASIDVLTDGRFEFGLGAGWHKTEYDWIDLPFDPPGVRVSRLEEALQVVKGLWGDGPFSFKGHYYTINDMNGTPKPVQSPHPPIFIGAGGKRLLGIAGREADIVGILGQTPRGGGVPTDVVTEEGLAEKVGWVRAAAGARFAQIELGTLMLGVAVTDDAQASAERLAGMWGLAAERVVDSVHFLIGSVEQIVERLLAHREMHGISYISVYGRDMEALAPVIARLKGR